MSKYHILVRILDALRAEAENTPFASKYAVSSIDEESIAQAQSRAFIHLYLKVMFGLTDFLEREHFITDGTYDGGIDGYFIDKETRKIHLLQSKFRRTEKNFECSPIKSEELLSMDVDRVTGGRTEDARGNRYNGKILGLVREISEISDIARYSYHIVILANCDNEARAYPPTY